MVKAVYPLKQVMEIKIKRVEEAEKIVQEKRKALEAEQKKLEEREAERDKVAKHHADKLKQLRQCLDEGTTTDKIIEMKVYLKIAKERVLVEEKKVKDQKNQVEIADKNLKEAQNQLRMRRLEVDKLEAHKKDWGKQVRKEEELVEANEQDELGNIIYSTRKLRS